MKQKIINYISKHRDAILVISTIIFELIVYAFSSCLEKTYIVILPCILLYIIALCLILSTEKSLKKNLFYVIYATGVILRTIYIFKTDIYTRQHDVQKIFEDGHLAYIYTIFKTHHLPTTNKWQFYHPPLWHFLGAAWLHINTFFKIPLEQSLEGIQIISLLLSSFIIIIVDKICTKFKFTNKYRLLIDLLFAAHPFLIIMSGQINNDILVTFLQFLVILLLINYNDDKSIKNIIYLALATGLCVMTKMNGALMAIPILYIFIKEFIEIIKTDKTKIKPFLIKIFILGIIALPIGLWFQVRNIILFKDNSIPRAGEWLYRGDIPLFKRLLTINIKELFNYAKMDSDYNLPAFIIKSSIFGEYGYDNINILAKAMITINVILIIFSICLMILYIKRKKYNIYMNILIITWIITIGGMLYLNIKNPEACSMDFRYIGICLLPGITVLAYMGERIKKKFPVKIMEISILIFAILSIIFAILIK